MVIDLDGLDFERELKQAKHISVTRVEDLDDEHEREVRSNAPSQVNFNSTVMFQKRAKSYGWSVDSRVKFRRNTAKNVTSGEARATKVKTGERAIIKLGWRFLGKDDNGLNRYGEWTFSKRPIT